MGKTKEETQKHVDGFITQLEQEILEREKFFHEKQNVTMDKIYKHLIEASERIDCEEVLYFPEKFSFAIDEFTMLFQNILNYADYKKKACVDADVDFPNTVAYVKYKDVVIELFETYGQGVFSVMGIADGGADYIFYYEELEYIKTL